MNRWEVITEIPCTAWYDLILTSEISTTGTGLVLIPEQVNKAEIIGLFDSWQRNQPPEIIEKFKQIISVVRSPAWIARVSFLDDHEKFLSVLALKGDNNPEYPVIIIAGDTDGVTFRVYTLPSVYHLAGDIADYITAGPPLIKESIALSMPVSSFLSLCGIADLRKRMHYCALLDHTDEASYFSLDGLQRIVKDSIESKDLRWLLPHVMSILPANVLDYHNMDLIQECRWLVEHQYLKTGDNPARYQFTGNGLTFLDSLNMSISRAAIMIIREPVPNKLVIDTGVIIRVPFAIWGISIGKDTGGTVALLSTLNFQTLLEFISDLLTHSDVPEIVSEPSTEGSQQTEKVKSTIIFCTECGESLPGSAKFCRKCGKSVHKTDNY